MTWPVRPLGELVDVLDSRRVPVSAKVRGSRPGTVPYYGAAGPVGTIDEALFDEPLVLLGEDGVQFFDPAKPKAYLIDGPSWVNNHAHVLRPRADIDRHFLLHFLNWTDYRSYANGTTRLKLTQAAMKRMPVNVPAPAEQRRIVEILEDHLSHLDAADVGVEAAGRRLGLLEGSLIAELGAGPRVRLGDLALASGYGTSEKCVAGGPGVPVVRIPNIQRGRVDLSDEKRAASASVDLSSFQLRPGDVLIVRTNGSKTLIGRSAVADGTVHAAFASYLIRYQVDFSRVRPEWVSLLLGSAGIRAEIERRAASSAGQYNLSLKKLDSLEIPVPSLVEQDWALKRFYAQKDALSRLEDQNLAVRRRSLVMRRALLSAAFSGQLTGRASDLDRVEEAIDA